METTFDRRAEDLGNIVALEHVNLAVPDQQRANLFYVTGLGLTRDPFLMTGTSNMWINIGKSQVHLPVGPAQMLRGRIGMVIPERDAMVRRLSRVRRHLEGTRFDFTERDEFVDVCCPWGNRIRCHQPGDGLGAMKLGVAYVEFQVPAGSADGIARFYSQIMGAPVAVNNDPEGRAAHVTVGNCQQFIFRETSALLPDYDGHHVQIYIADFSGPYRKLLERGLITEESDQHQYRFRNIFDPDNGRTLYMLEHEVRSMRHPLYGRPLVNRNPSQNNADYQPGHDAFLS